MRKITKIILHCSDSDVPKHDNIGIIKGWHLARGFGDVGYHRFYQKSGTMQKGRPVEKEGAHCKGLNKESLGYCLSGKNEFTFPQFRSVAAQIELDKKEYGLTNKDVIAHCDTPSGKEQGKTCPNFDVDLFKRKWLKPDKVVSKGKKDDRKRSTGSNKSKPAGSKQPAKPAAKAAKPAAKDTSKK